MEFLVFGCEKLDNSKQLKAKDTKQYPRTNTEVSIERKKCRDVDLIPSQKQKECRGE